MSRFRRRDLAGATAYVPGEQPAPEERVVKLNTNENPYPPPESVLAAARAAARRLRLYPDPRARNLREAAARAYGCGALTGANVVATNGSDEALRLIFAACVAPGDVVAWPAPSYSLYPILARIAGGRAVEVDWHPDYRLPVEALAGAGARAIFVTNPNAPSGTLTPVADLRRLAEAAPDALVVVDEAYVEFAPDGASAVPLVAERENVVVVRTLSKAASLAGLRVGFAIARPDVVADLDLVRDSYNVGAVAQAGGLAALEAAEAMRASCAKVIASRARLAAGLRAAGFRVWPSAANFVMAEHDGIDGAEVYKRLKARGILVRHFAAPPIEKCVRISVGTDAEVDILLETMRSVLGTPAAAR